MYPNSFIKANNPYQNGCQKPFLIFVELKRKYKVNVPVVRMAAVKT